jgi:hypothetical protein
MDFPGFQFLPKGPPPKITTELDTFLISGLFTFALKEGVSEDQATHLANRMPHMLSHLLYTPRSKALFLDHNRPEL